MFLVSLGTSAHIFIVLVVAVVAAAAEAVLFAKQISFLLLI